jgi:tetratricopeptide (TPR) repeat protein
MQNNNLRVPSVEAAIGKALAAHQRGDLLGAQTLYEEVLRVQPKHFDSLHLSGVIAAQVKDLPKALKLLNRAISAEPRNAALHAALRNRGLVLKQMDRLDDALLNFNLSIARKPDFTEAYADRILVLRHLGRWQAVVADYDRLLAIHGAHPRSYHGRAEALLELKQSDAALQSIDRAIELAPLDADALCTRANVLVQLGRNEDALANLEQALTIKPDHAGAWYNRANLLKELGRSTDAVASYERALAIEPKFVSAFVNLGVLLRERGEVGEAVTSFERALALQPEHARARFNRACLLLLRGEYEQGWDEFEWRLQCFGAVVPQVRGRKPARWNGSEPLAGKIILVHAEQGLGDTLQFCRYIKPVADLGARIIFQVQAPLAGLLARLEGVAEIIRAGTTAPACDYHCPLMSLPGALQTTIDTIPGTSAYLKTDPVRSAFWQRQLGERGRPRVGLVWSGGFRKDQPELRAVNARRNIPLATLVDVCRPDVQFYSLQKGQPAESELQQLREAGRPGVTILDDTALLNDFEDTAALVEQLDLVICVDTSTAHLAGALGKPVWILHRFDGCWRWLLDRSDSPWYLSARLYRQRAPDDWGEVIERVRTDLAQWAASA